MAGNAPYIPGCRDLSLVGERVARSLFTGHSDEIGAPVTVTVFPPLSEGRTRRDFDQAARTAQRLGAHPSVLTIHGWGHADDGRPWLVTDPQPAESVDTSLTNEGPLEVERALQVGVLLAGALETAHRAGIVHGDLQPERVVFGPQGEPLLVETGLAGFAVFPGLGALNNPVRYHSPPEVLERTEVTPATDVYSLATTTYALLAGRAPHQKPAEITDSNASLLLRILQMPLPPIERSDLPPGLLDALRAPLSANPGRRPQSAIEVAWLLQDVQRSAGFGVTEPVVFDLDDPGFTPASASADAPLATHLDAVPTSWAPPEPAAPFWSAPAAGPASVPSHEHATNGSTPGTPWAADLADSGVEPAAGATLWPSTWPSENPPQAETPSWATTPAPDQPDLPTDQSPWATTPPPDQPADRLAGQAEVEESAGDGLDAAADLDDVWPPSPAQHLASGSPPSEPVVDDAPAASAAFARPPELDELPAWYTDPLPSQRNGDEQAAAHTTDVAPGEPDTGPELRPDLSGTIDPPGQAPLPRRQPGEAGRANGHIAAPRTNGSGPSSLPGSGDDLRSLFGEVVGDRRDGPPALPVVHPHGPSPDLAVDPLATVEARHAAWELPSPSEPPARPAPPDPGTPPPALTHGAAESGRGLGDPQRADLRPTRPAPRQVAGLPTVTSGAADDKARPSSVLRPSAGPPALPVIVLVVVVIVLTIGVAWLVLAGDSGGTPATERDDRAATDDAGPAPSDVEVSDAGGGLLITWTGDAEQAYVVTVLSAGAAPQDQPPTEGTTALVAHTGDLDGGRCVTVAPAAEDDGTAGPASTPACTPGADPDDMMQG